VFGYQFLYLVFSKNALTLIVKVQDRLRGLSFGHRYEAGTAQLLDQFFVHDGLLKHFKLLQNYSNIPE